MEISVISGSSCIFSYNRPIGILANFLTDDIGFRDIKYMIDWIKNDKYKVTTLNYSFIKKSGKNIHIYFLYDSYGINEHKKREKFETTKEDLINILKQWKDITKVRGLIFLNKEGGKTSISIGKITRNKYEQKNN